MHTVSLDPSEQTGSGGIRRSRNARPQTASEVSGRGLFHGKRHKSRTERPIDPKFESQVEGGSLYAPPKAFPFSPTGGAITAKSAYVFHKNVISGGSIPSQPTSAMSRDGLTATAATTRAILQNCPFLVIISVVARRQHTIEVVDLYFFFLYRI